MSAHGPDRASYDAAVAADLQPRKITGSMAFMFESRHVLRPTGWAMATSLLQPGYDACWDGFAKAQLPERG
jgi:homogentisate 1,2-dioxygenase